MSENRKGDFFGLTLYMITSFLNAGVDTTENFRKVRVILMLCIHINVECVHRTCTRLFVIIHV